MGIQEETSDKIRLYCALQDEITILENDKIELSAQIRTFMRDCGWSNYDDEASGARVSIVEDVANSFDVLMLKMYLKSEEYKRCVRTINKEKLVIMSKEQLIDAKKFIEKQLPK